MFSLSTQKCYVNKGNKILAFLLCTIGFFLCKDNPANEPEECSCLKHILDKWYFVNVKV